VLRRRAAAFGILHDRVFCALAPSGLLAACSIIGGSRRGLPVARSHGLYRIPGCVQAVRSGKVDPQARPEIASAAGAVVRTDARGGFALHPLRLGRPLLADKAREFGIAALALNNCYHFSAPWADIEIMAEGGLVALSCTIGAHNVALASGSAPAFGTNPFAFAFPRGEGRKPFVFDLSSNVVAKGEIELRRRSGRHCPVEWQ